MTTHLIVRTAFLREHPEAVKGLIEGQVEANAFVNAHGAEAQGIVNEGIAKITGKKLDAALISTAWSNLSFTNDPIAPSLAASAQHAADVGLLEKVDLKGIYDLDALNEVLRGQGLAPVVAL